jgi:membrane fusion protein (multidrug efflux system)
MTGTFGDEVQGHDANQARGNPSAESPEHDRVQANARGNVLPEKVEKTRPRERRGRVFLGGILIFGLLIGGGIYYWLLTRNVESTDDAYTDERAVTIAPQVSGLVVSLDVTDNEFVHQGQALIHIDPRQYEGNMRMTAIPRKARSIWRNTSSPVKSSGPRSRARTSPPF